MKSRRYLPNKRAKTNQKTILMILILIIFFNAVVSVIFFQKGSNEKHGTILKYKESGDINYQVNLIENKFFENRTLESNKNYIVSLIDNLNLLFNYELNFEDNVKYTYHYDMGIVFHVTCSKGSQEKDLYTDSKNLFSSEVKSGNSKNLNIHESFQLDYNKYNEFLKYFEKELSVSPGGYLEITYNINVKGKYSNLDDFNFTPNIKLTIPLQEKILSIDRSKATVNNDGQFLKLEIDMLWMTISIILAAIALILVLFVAIIVTKIILRQTKYIKNLKKIFKKYEQLIIKSNKDLRFSCDNIIDLRDFEDLICASDRIQQPIKYYETQKDSESIFVVDNFGNEVYIYRLSTNKLEQIERNLKNENTENQ